MQSETDKSITQIGQFLKLISTYVWAGLNAALTIKLSYKESRQQAFIGSIVAMALGP